MARTRSNNIHRPKRNAVRSEPNGRALVLRARELKWRETHGRQLRKYAGEWVALEAEQIVAHGRDAGAVVTEARARGIASPYVFFVHPKPRPGTVLMGF